MHQNRHHKEILVYRALESSKYIPLLYAKLLAKSPQIKRPHDPGNMGQSVRCRSLLCPWKDVSLCRFGRLFPKVLVIQLRLKNL